MAKKKKQKPVEPLMQLNLFDESEMKKMEQQKKVAKVQKDTVLFRSMEPITNLFINEN